MRILISPNAFKSSLSAKKISCVAKEYLGQFHEVRTCPMADGGDDSARIIAEHLGAQPIRVEVANPVGNRINSSYFYRSNMAVISLSDTSGIALLAKSEQNPLCTSSYGTGEMVMDAILKGFTEIVICIGGSATVDGGTGALRALGFKFLDYCGRELNSNEFWLDRVRSIVLPEYSFSNIHFTVLCDVVNPLLGEAGAVNVFARQKGATQDSLSFMESGMTNYANVLRESFGREVDIDMAGSAGGFAAGMYGALDVNLESGASYIADMCSMDDHIRWADVVITGEGRLDGQTKFGKAPVEILRRAQALDTPVYGVFGSVGGHDLLFDKVESFVDEETSLEYALAHPEELLLKALRNLFK